jgi:hypothetical protein
LEIKTKKANKLEPTTEVFKEVVREILSRIIKISNCQSNGIRLQKNGDFPFYVQKGYPDFFIDRENSLLVRKKNEIVFSQEGSKNLECMCGNIINANFNPSFPFFTNKGSFWTNSTTNLLSSITEEQKEFIGYTRNLCNLSGYESVALIPLNIEGKTLGLIHLADPRENMFTIKKISKIETLANEFAGIIKKAYEIQEKLLQIDKKIA